MFTDPETAAIRAHLGAAIWSIFGGGAAVTMPATPIVQPPPQRPPGNRRARRAEAARKRSLTGVVTRKAP